MLIKNVINIYMHDFGFRLAAMHCTIAIISDNTIVCDEVFLVFPSRIKTFHQSYSMYEMVFSSSELVSRPQTSSFTCS